MCCRIAQIILIGLMIPILSCASTKLIEPAKPETNLVQEPVFNVVSIKTDPDEVIVEGNLTVKAQISIANGTSGEYTAILKFDNNQIAEKKIKVNQTSLAEVAFVVPIKEPGDHEISLGNKTIKFRAIAFEAKNPITIQYDGLGEGVQTYTYQGMFLEGGAGHLVWFTAPAYPFKVTAISMKAGAIAKNQGPLDDKNFTVTFWDKITGKPIWSKNYPWKIYEIGISSGPHWEEIKIPDVIVKDDFYLEVVTHSDPADHRYKYIEGTVIGNNSNMALGFENTQESKRSFYSFNGIPLTEAFLATLKKNASISTVEIILPEAFKGNWNIRVTGNGLSGIQTSGEPAKNP